MIAQFKQQKEKKKETISKQQKVSTCFNLKKKKAAAGFIQDTMVRESDHIQAEFRKGRGTRDQIASICWITEKAREFQ